jgi:2-polyprenyl-3-methyl-5-hydroxy-6-metoxy-1,4-benzoquinol methylase
MNRFPTPEYLHGYWHDCFNIKEHLRDFLQLDESTLEQKLSQAKQELAEIGHRDFNWEEAAKFYRDHVKETYLFELSAWHLSSVDYIGETLLLISSQAKGRVLDFGGGIGTHAIAAALCPQVEEVVYCDINPINRNFTASRVAQMGLENKVKICDEIIPESTFDTVICFDVIEHLPDPVSQLLKFHEILSSSGKMLVNWYFFKGFNNEFSFHLDDPKIIDAFFTTLGQNFLEVFHPYYITARSYRKLT